MAIEAPWLVSMSTGVLVPPGCRAWLCDHCGPRRARRLGLAVDLAGYDRCLTVTSKRAPKNARQAMARFAHLLRAEGPWEWVWSIEHGGATGMVHAHAACRGAWRENKARKTVLARARQAGWGFPSIEAPRGQMGGYASKFGRYVTKGAGNYQEWRGWNGGRPWHWSRRYTDGVPMRDWIREHAPARDQGPWRAIWPHDLHGWPEVRDAARRAAEDALAASYQRADARRADADEGDLVAGLVALELGAVIDWTSDAPGDLNADGKLLR